MTTGLSLRPQRITGTAPEGDVLGGKGFLVCFLVHEAQHQYVLRRHILYDGRHQAAHLFKIYLHILTFIPSLCKYCFSSGTGISPK